MRKRALLVSGLFVISLAFCMNAYAAEGENAAWTGMCNSIGGFFHKAMPWNWGEWAGK